jgi:hypothetical protein
MPTPYDTGKVKIGLLYEPPREYAMSRDAELLQASMLNPPISRGTDYFDYEVKHMVTDTLMFAACVAAFAGLMYFPTLFILFTERFQ